MVHHQSPGSNTQVLEGSGFAVGWSVGRGSVKRIFGRLAVRRQAKVAGRRGPLPLLVRSAAATALVFRFFEVPPGYPASISEAHLILGSTLIA